MRSSLNPRREERNGLFLFQFRVESKRDHTLYGGPWYYNHSMLLLAEYDGIGEATTIPLQFLKVWVAVKVLSIALCNERALSFIGSALGR